jgi:hypothetical protein
LGSFKGEFLIIHSQIKIPKFPNVTKPQSNKKHRHIKISPVTKINPKPHKNLSYANNKPEATLKTHL